MSRCRIGDLAFVVDCVEQENLGAIVKVQARAVDCPDCGGIRWDVVAQGRPLKGWRWIIPGIFAESVLVRETIAHDSHLRPIRPDGKGQEDRIIEKEKVC